MRAIAESYSHGLPEPQSAEHFRVDSVPPGQNVHFTGPGQWLPGVLQRFAGRSVLYWRPGPPPRRVQEDANFHCPIRNAALEPE